MNWWKRFTNKFKKYEKWIEIKVPEYFRNNKENDFLKDEEDMLGDEESVLQKLRREEE